MKTVCPKNHISNINVFCKMWWAIFSEYLRTSRYDFIKIKVVQYFAANKETKRCSNFPQIQWGGKMPRLLWLHFYSTLVIIKYKGWSLIHILCSCLIRITMKSSLKSAGILEAIKISLVDKKAQQMPIENSH